MPYSTHPFYTVTYNQPDGRSGRGRGWGGSSIGSLPEIILGHHFRLDTGKLDEDDASFFNTRRGRERGKKRLRKATELIINQTKGKHVFS